MSENVTNGTELEPEVKAWFDNKGEVPAKAEAEPAKEPAKTEAKAPDPAVDAKREENVKAEEQQAAEPEADDNDDGEDDGSPSPDGQPRKQRKVNWSAYSREKQQRKEMEARLAGVQREYEEKMALINQRLAMIGQMPPQMAPQVQQQPAQPEAPAIPDPEQDIFAFAKYTAAELAAMKAKERQQAEQAMLAEQRQREMAMKRQQAQQYERAIIQEYSKWGEERAKIDPDFMDAYKHALNVRVKQLMRHGMDQQRAVSQAHREEFELAARSLQANQDPTQIIVDYAMDLGWQPKAKQAAPDPKRLDSIAKAQDVHKTMTGTGSPGAGRSPEVNAEALAKMSHDEFAAFLEKAGDKGFRAAMSR